MSLPSSPLFETAIRSLSLVSRGKVRDIYAVGVDKLLIVATDRLSAFDVILPDPIPRKGQVLTAVSNFWFKKLTHVIPNQLTHIDPKTVVAPEEAAQVAGRAVVARRLRPLPIEAVARGYLIGSGWKDYRQTGAVCGLPLPAGLKLAARLPEPLFTPATKAGIGEHDENISFSQAQALCAVQLADFLGGAGKSGEALCKEARDATLELYREAAAYALARGIIIADTKFEFGVDETGTLHLIDEALTPDSSRFWPADIYREGENPASFDKQFVRDYLETLDWNKKAPGPRLPAEVIAKTSEKYVEACERLTGERLPD
ncbi:MAG: phosphoribosylaminoimidazolesuccinocarboxamide synthase [Zoogloeaceae bacterium]|jgi:phosphoribosylaminoimidazole-succinocarboxamide synthase|nr:phosphoribosylaminoimidazolesuccinocarboxamide synthase [Zoogloeaceae bacterium]